MDFDNTVQTPEEVKRYQGTGGFVIFLVVVSLLLAGGAYTWQHIVIERYLQSQRSVLDIWAVSQLPRQVLIFRIALQSVKEVPGRPEKEEIELAWELVMSRLAILTEGETGDFLEGLPKRRNNLPRIKDILADIDLMMPMINTDPLLFIEKIEEELDELSHISQELHAVFYTHVNEERQKIEDLLDLVQIAGNSLAIFAVLLVVLLIWMVWKSERARYLNVLRLFKELKNSEVWNQAVLQSTADGIIVIGTDGIIIDFNIAAEKIFQYKREEVIDRNMSDIFIPAEFREQHKAGIANYLETGKGRVLGKKIELPALRKDGATITVEMVINDLTLGEKTFFSSFIRDITEKNRLTAELQQAKKMEAIGVLTSGIAHDFNNILTPILGYMELVKAKIAGNSSVDKYLQAMERSAYRAKDLVSRILLFSRDVEPEKRLTKLNTLVKEEVKLLQSALPTTVTISSRIDKDVASVVGDITQLHTLLINLSTNAAHAMPKGGVLEIRLENAEVEQQPVWGGEKISGSFVRLVVKDSGTGIDPETLERIFDPFFTTKDAGHGTGLGLSTVFGIMAQHDGYISVETEVGVGTTFSIFLPACEDEEVIEEEKSAGDIPFGKEQVLFVDDEDEILVMAKRGLESLGYEVTTCNRGDEGLALFFSESANYEIVISDQTMPGKTGMELAGEIRGKYPDFPIIICTGNAQALEAERPNPAPWSLILKKPYTVSDIGHAIRAIVDASSA